MNWVTGSGTQSGCTPGRNVVCRRDRNVVVCCRGSSHILIVDTQGGVEEKGQFASFGEAIGTGPHFTRFSVSALLYYTRTLVGGSDTHSMQ